MDMVEELIVEHGLVLSNEERTSLYNLIRFEAKKLISDKYMNYHNREAQINASDLAPDYNFFQNLHQKSIRRCHLNGDFSKFNFAGVDIAQVTFSADSILPANPDFFQTLASKSIMGVTLPRMDYSGYNFNGVLLRMVRFTPDSKLPKDRNLFKNVSGNDIEGCVLPKIDMNDYDFSYVHITSVEFTKDTIFSNDMEFFRNRRRKKVNGVSFPEHDYSDYNFEKVRMAHAKFTPGSKLPSNPDLFVNLASSITECVLPEMDYSNYNFKEVNVTGAVFPPNAKLPMDFTEQIQSYPYSKLTCVWPVHYVEERLLYDVPECGVIINTDTLPTDLTNLLKAKYKHSAKVTLITSIEATT